MTNIYIFVLAGFGLLSLLYYTSSHSTKEGLKPTIVSFLPPPLTADVNLPLDKYFALKEKLLAERRQREIKNLSDDATQMKLEIIKMNKKTSDYKTTLDSLCLRECKMQSMIQAHQGKRQEQNAESQDKVNSRTSKIKTLLS